MEKQALQEKLELLIEAITNLNSSRHNPSKQLTKNARRIFDEIIDEITNGQ